MNFGGDVCKLKDTSTTMVHVRGGVLLALSRLKSSAEKCRCILA
jgi:hypothetical protein